MLITIPNRNNIRILFQGNDLYYSENIFRQDNNSINSISYYH